MKISTEIDKALSENFLEHFGVKGMKWGVRRSKAELAKGGGSSKDKNASEKPKPKAASGPNSREAKKSIKEMSDKELKDYVNRLNMEQQYARMQPTPFTQRAAKFATDIVVGVAKQQLTNQLSKQVGKQFDLLGGKGVPKPDIRLNPNRLVAPPSGPRLG